MKRKVAIGLGLFHILFILMSNLYSGYAEYCAYNSKPTNKILSKCANVCFENKPTALYAIYTGTSSSYGFFAPNVRSPVRLNCIYEGNEVLPHFNSSEGELRYNNMVGALVENINLAKEEIKGEQIKVFDIKKRYNELVFRNIAVKLWNDCQLPPSDANMSLSFVKHTPLVDARQGKQYLNEYLTLQQLKLTLGNEKNN